MTDNSRGARRARIGKLRERLGRDPFAPLAGAPRKTVIYGPEFSPEGSRERLRYLERVSPGLRLAVENATEAASRSRCTGYFTDFDYCDTTHGAVLQLPSGRDGLRFVPACTDPYNSGDYIADFHSLTDCKDSAARWADSIAERYAENEREYRAKDMARQDIAEARETIQRCRSELRALLAELRAAGQQCGPAVRAAILASVRATRRESREAFETIQQRRADYWSAVSRY